MSYLKYPIRDLTPYAVDILINRSRQMLATALARFGAAWWGIELGKSSQFAGLPILQRHPTGSIVIGDHATFRSSEWSNSIGINRRCFISAGRNAVIDIGDQCGFSGTIIAASKSIIIGNRVLCGANCTIVDTDRHILEPCARAKNEKAEAAPIVIENDVFLCMNVVVLKGCTIGKGTVVAANSIVTHSLPEGVVAGGMPAKVLKLIESKG